MNQNSVKTIGMNDEPRKDSYLVYVNQADGLKVILNKEFDEWSNFDSWESISVQQWIFSRALEVFRGKKIDIKCDCCEHNDLMPNDFESIKKEKCFGKKSAYMIEKVVDEIVLAVLAQALILRILNYSEIQIILLDWIKQLMILFETFFVYIFEIII